MGGKTIALMLPTSVLRYIGRSRLLCLFGRIAALFSDTVSCSRAFKPLHSAQCAYVCRVYTNLGNVRIPFGIHKMDDSTENYNVELKRNN